MKRADRREGQAGSQRNLPFTRASCIDICAVPDELYNVQGREEKGRKMGYRESFARVRASGLQGHREKDGGPHGEQSNHDSPSYRIVSLLLAGIIDDGEGEKDGVEKTTEEAFAASSLLAAAGRDAGPAAVSCPQTAP